MSCLFTSLSYFVNGIDEVKLRSIICDYLKSNPKILDDVSVNDIISWESGKTGQEYVSSMENASTWGSGLEIKAFCDIFGVKVNVHCDGRVIEFLPNKSNVQIQINIRYMNRNHYVPI